jgi:hypothetical protein
VHRCLYWVLTRVVGGGPAFGLLVWRLFLHLPWKHVLTGLLEHVDGQAPTLCLLTRRARTALGTATQYTRRNVALSNTPTSAETKGWPSAGSRKQVAAAAAAPEQTAPEQRREELEEALGRMMHVNVLGVV